MAPLQADGALGVVGMEMSTKNEGSNSNGEIRWDPYSIGSVADPYPIFRRMREEAPIYYNDQYNFYAISRYDDCLNILGDRDTYISGDGGVLDMMGKGITIPSGMFIYEDAPRHTIHRSLLTRVFTPKRMAALDANIREYCANALDPLVGGGELDFIEHLGSEMPMRVIGALLGIPEEDLKAAQRYIEERARPQPGQPKESNGDAFVGEEYSEYIYSKLKSPSDDLISDLLYAEFEGSDGETKRLSPEEVKTFVALLFGAGNETTNRLIGWTGKLLAEHPEQRRQINENRALIPQAIEEILRFEPPGWYVGRTTAKEVEHHGVTIPAGVPLLAVIGAANRDESKFENAEVFDIHRPRQAHLTFGYGFHNCLGNALARVEGRIALEEILNRFPEWEVDMRNAKMSPVTSTRGWERLPAHVV
jgi:cytochrome P450